MSAPRKEAVEQLKQQGNDCVKAGNYSEAVIHYTHAIQLDRNNHLLHSNRSLAFLKVQQYYFAIEDAKDVIRLQPNWPKGHYRKGEVEFQVGMYTQALISYGQAFLLDPTNNEVKEAISKTNKEIARIKKERRRQPLLFCGVGSMVGVLIVFSDQYLTKTPSIQYVILQILLVFIFCGLGYGCLRIYNYIQDSQKNSLLDPPVDLLKEMNPDKDEASKDEQNESANKHTEHRPHRKGGIGAGRQRYKKGKT